MKTYHFWQKLASLQSAKVTAETWDTGQDEVDEKDFLEVYLVADHESQTEPAGDASGEEDVIIPYGCNRVDAIGECAQWTNHYSIQNAWNLQFGFTILYQSMVGI